MNTEKNISYIDKSGAVFKIEPSERKKKKEYNYGKYLNMGFYLSAPLLAGVVVGLKLDTWMQTKPIFLLLFITLGSVASFYNLIKLTKDTDA